MAYKYRTYVILHLTNCIIGICLTAIVTGITLTFLAIAVTIVLLWRRNVNNLKVVKKYPS